MALTEDEQTQLAALTAKAGEPAPDDAVAEGGAEGAAAVAAEVGAQTVETIGQVAAVVAEVVQSAEHAATARIEQAREQAATEVEEAQELARIALGVAAVVAEQAAEAVELAEAAPPVRDADGSELAAPAGELDEGGASHDLGELAGEKVTPDPGSEGASYAPKAHWFFRKRGGRA